MASQQTPNYRLSRWDGGDIRWREANDVVASNGLLIDQLRPYLR